MMLLALFLFFAVGTDAETADAIMARVAENQNQSQEMRTAFVYHQNVMIRLQRSKGKLAREEYSEFTVTPTATGTQKERTLFRGKFADHGKEVEFDQPAHEHKSVDIDADVANSLLESFTNDHRSRDGIERDLFTVDFETAAEIQVSSGRKRGLSRDSGLPCHVRAEEGNLR